VAVHSLSFPAPALPYSGKPAVEKIAELRAKMASEGVQAVVVSDLSEVCVVHSVLVYCWISHKFEPNSGLCCCFGVRARRRAACLVTYV
jgi:hypothetical protein